MVIVIRHGPLSAVCIYALIGLRLLAILAGHLFLIILQIQVLYILGQNAFRVLVEETLIP